MNSLTYNDHTNPLFVENKIIKFGDLIVTNQLLLAFEFKMKILPIDLNHLFTYTSDIHTHFTRVSSSSLYIPEIFTTNFGFYSLKYQVPVVWNDFSKDHPAIFKQSQRCFKKYISIK